MIARMKAKLYELLETPGGGRAGRIVDAFLIVLIVSNVVLAIVHTMPGIAARYGTFFWRFELLSVIVFSIEYVLRLWICTEDPSYRRPVLGRIKYLFSALSIIDLIAIVPFILPMIIPVDLIFMRSLRLMRLLRLLKLGRYSESMRMMGNILKAKKEEMAVSLTMSVILLLIASGLMYFIEGAAQPETFSSIPAAMWWGAMTMTTVGYGDVYPVTPAGKVLAGIIALLGISLFILPASIIAASYAAEIQKKKKGEHVVCPRCGTTIT
jgi:voltage-gated potassium channel